MKGLQKNSLKSISNMKNAENVDSNIINARNIAKVNSGCGRMNGRKFFRVGFSTLKRIFSASDSLTSFTGAKNELEGGRNCGTNEARKSIKALAVSSSAIFAFGFAAFASSIFPTHSAYADTSSISLSVSSSISLNLSGVSTSKNSGTSDTTAETIKITTNNYTGYTLSLQGKSASATALTNTDSSCTDTDACQIDSISAGTASVSSFADNTWGYKATKYNGSAWVNVSGNSAGNFLPSPTTTATVLDTTSAANSSDNKYNLSLAAKVDSTLRSGSYSGTFTVTAVANPIPYSISYTNDSSITGVSNMPSSQTGSAVAASVELSSTTPTRTDYNFMGWCTVATSTDTCSGTTYAAGASYPLSQTSNSGNTITLYAIWQEDGYRWEKYSLKTVYTWDKYDASYLYSWTKYNAQAKTTYAESKSSSTSSTSVGRSNARGYYYGTSYSFDSSTGKYTVNQATKPSSSASCLTIGSSKYYYITLASSSGSQTGSTMYYISSGSGLWTCSFDRYTYTSTSSTSYIQGSTNYGTVTSTSSSAYPSNGTTDNTYWYVSQGSGSYGKGSTSYGTVTSTSSSAYPSNGTPDNTYWYVSQGDGTTEKDTDLGVVTNPDMSAYPCDGIQDGYWYVFLDGSCANTVSFNQNSSGMLPTPTSQTSYSGHNLTVTYYPTTQTYGMVNSSTSDPYASLGNTVYLEAGKTYAMHAKTQDASSGSVDTSASIQVFYAISSGYNESQSLRFSGDQTKTFTVSTTGDYNIRMDNDFGKNMTIAEFWIDDSSIQYNSVQATQGSAMPTISSTIPTRDGYTFMGWYDNADYTSGTQYYTATNTSARNWDKDADTVLYAGWKIVFNGIETMQSMTSSICSAADVGDMAILKDTRDNKKYYVTKLADDNCWMTQNLDFDISASGLTSADSDVTSSWNSSSTYAPTATSSTISSSTDTTGTLSWNLGDYAYDGTTNSSCGTEATSYANCTSYGFSATSSPTVSANHYHVGNLYQWNAATAGTGGAITGDATDSICPKGWRLPTSTSSGEFQALVTAYSASSSVQTLLNSPLYFVRGGNVVSGALKSVGSYGLYWSSTAFSASWAIASYAYYFVFGDTADMNPSNYNARYLGLSVRCIADS